jgi:hypothetical protein
MQSSAVFHIPFGDGGSPVQKEFHHRGMPGHGGEEKRGHPVAVSGADRLRVFVEKPFYNLQVARPSRFQDVDGALVRPVGT